MPVSALLVALGLASSERLDGQCQTPEEMAAELISLRQIRNSRETLADFTKLYTATTNLEWKMRTFYNLKDENDTHDCGGKVDTWQLGCELPRPGNLHDIKSHAYYVGAIRKLHAFPVQVVQSLVASEWYHPGLTSRPVWCLDSCDLPLAQRLNAHFGAVSKELLHFWSLKHELKDHLRGVGAHTTSFDRLIAGNGTWQDVRLWRGRAFDRQLCDRYFRVTCSLVEASPEVWTNPWSHVLISILMPNSWVPFHQGHTNGQLTYHLPVMLPEAGAELALLERGGTLAEQETGILTHPEETTVSWTLGRTLVFDDSFTHAVRYRHAWSEAHSSGGAPRMLLLMRAWHPELEMKERMALREFIRRGGEEEPEGYDMLPAPGQMAP
ncbi:unnamed protein product [Durusdinium trenchii]|uniref:Aspartyl/asparaginyl beta-hydroxylase (Aspartate beta-hydroxylase) (ASP beta-hydroxylase) (Peptide-aspartate beta-dioxygenase) n=2 Tax=Durusdinium trenchii TaxID=1381693 RepID=A0ABP0HW18_9DINO